MADDHPDILRAVEILRAGGLVAFPTETVYGLGADATSANAVHGIFRAKGRPATNPLIVHVADAFVARRYAADWPREAELLAQAFWPGPLTLVVRKAREIVPEATSGLETVGLRAPDHPMALSLLRAFGGAVAAPSANRSNRISPTTVEHVRRDLGDAVDLILDGGPCRIGIESTVLDLTRARPAILRPGGVVAAQIERLIGPVDTLNFAVRDGAIPASPGQHAVHYAPQAPTYRFASNQTRAVIEWCRSHPGVAAAFLPIEGGEAARALRSLAMQEHHVTEMPREAVAYAARLYAALHEADGRGVCAIWIELPPAMAEWMGVRDRIGRASREWTSPTASPSD